MTMTSTSFQTMYHSLLAHFSHISQHCTLIPPRAVGYAPPSAWPVRIVVLIGACNPMWSRPVHNIMPFSSLFLPLFLFLCLSLALSLSLFFLVSLSPFRLFARALSLSLFLLLSSARGQIRSKGVAGRSGQRDSARARTKVREREKAMRPNVPIGFGFGSS